MSAIDCQGLIDQNCRSQEYVQAEQTGWALYLEGSTDLAILRAFARRLGKQDAIDALERPFVRYVGNQPTVALRHFHALREACPEFRGIALFDRLEREAPPSPTLPLLAWKRREIENYLCSEATLEAWARASAREAETRPLHAPHEVERRRTAMREATREMSEALETLGRGSPWSPDIKASDAFLKPLFHAWSGKLGLPNLMNKGNFHELADHVPDEEIDPEIGEKLDAIAAVAASASPRADD